MPKRDIRLMLQHPQSFFREIGEQISGGKLSECLLGVFRGLSGFTGKESPQIASV